MIRRLAFLLAMAIFTSPLLGLPGRGAAQSSPPTASPPTGQEEAALKSRLKALRSALASDVCQDPAPARALLADPSVAAITPASPNGKPAALAKTDLAKLLKASVLLIVAGDNSGTGFAVAPNLVMTNHHVVAKAPQEKILIAGPALGGQPRLGAVVAQIEEPGPAGQDFALLRIEGPPLTTILPLSPIVEELQPIVAAGFPGLLIGNDIQFHRLMRGDLSAMPELILSQGAVMAIQNRSAKLPSIAHNAQISSGNSGGPLVDACGRIVGINTYIRVASDQGTNAGYALGSEAVIRFLTGTGETPRQQGGTCG